MVRWFHTLLAAGALLGVVASLAGETVPAVVKPQLTAPKTNLSAGNAVALSAIASAPADPCYAKTFRTQLVGQACAAPDGSQSRAKSVMTDFMRDTHVTSCTQCHTILAPRYALKADGLEQFVKLGGQ